MTAEPVPDALSIGEFVRRSFTIDAQKHVALFAGVAATFYIALRFTVVAAWDTETAAGVLQAMGPGDAVVGTVIQGIPAVVAAGCAIVLGWNTYLLVRFGRQPPLGIEHIVDTVVLILVLTLIPMSLLLAPVVLCVLLSILLAFFDRKSPSRLETVRSRRVILTSALAAVALRFLLDGTMWLPVESIDPSGDAKPFAGYVLNRAGDTTTVMRRDTREIVFLPSKGLEHNLCGTRQALTRPAIALVSKDEWPSYPQCPD